MNLAAATPRSSSLLLNLLLGILLLGEEVQGKCCHHRKNAAKIQGRSMKGGRSLALPIVDIAQLIKDFNITSPGSSGSGNIQKEEEDAGAMVKAIEPQLNAICYAKVRSEWELSTNINKANEAASINATILFSQFHRNKLWPLFTKFDWRNFSNPTLKRHFYLESMLGASALPPDRMERYTNVKNDMVKIFSTAKICRYGTKDGGNATCDMRLDPEITSIFATSRDPEELLYYWNEWRDASGKKMPALYAEYVEISNEMARLNGFHDIGEIWRRPYEDPLMPLDFWSKWGVLKPLFLQLHAFVRRRLHNKYGPTLVPLNSTIPAHLTGNMWAQNWGNIWDIIAPFSGAGVTQMDVTDAMKGANYTPTQMMRKADEFFISLGLPPAPDEFWAGSVFQRIPGRDMVCHPEAWDFCNQKHWFIKMCSEVNMRDFITMHHEMGHVQYYMGYKEQLNTFRDGANPGFHEALGDAVSLSASSPIYLSSTLRLLPPNYEDTEENRINFLMSMAVRMIVDIPWILVMEQWRWDVFCGKIDPSKYNCHWWDLRVRLQGVHPPSTRCWDDFDPGAKYHIPSNVPYDRYFAARLLTYQLHESMCEAAGHKGPLHLCSIYGSKAAGDKLKELIKLGSVIPWPKALEKVTGKLGLDAGPLMNYYGPLMQWLAKENEKNGDRVGWEDPEREEICTPKTPYP